MSTDVPRSGSQTYSISISSFGPVHGKALASDFVEPTSVFEGSGAQLGVSSRCFLVVTEFVLLSGGSVEPDINSQGMGRPHAYLKQLGDVRRAKWEWAAIRPTWFQQNFAELENYRDSIVTESVIYSATGDGKIPWVATEDITGCAFQLLTQKNAPNDEYLILGPELLSYGDIDEVLSKTLGREITHKSLLVDELVDYYVQQGLPTHIAEMLGNADLAIETGSEDRMNSVVVELTGKRPSRFCDRAEKNKETWASQA